MADLLYPVILCGGGGTRLWPRSRLARPKPFLPLLGERTLFQQALDRTRDPAVFAPPTVVAGAAHVPLVEEQAGGPLRIVVEPLGRNTAPAIALAALLAPSEAVLLVCPSDHHIADTAAFQRAVADGAELAREGYLVALGLEPTAPETGYGYLKQGASLGRGAAIDRFVEKPDAPTAERFLAEGGYLWNGGIFLLRADRYLEELERHRPDMAAGARAAMRGARIECKGDAELVHPDAERFAAIQPESIDYAVMENTDRAALVPVSMGWSDIGNWDALHGARPRDDDGNHVAGDVHLSGCRNVMVDTDGPRVSVIGLSDVVVVVDGNEVLVTTRAAAQQVGKLPGAASQ